MSRLLGSIINILISFHFYVVRQLLLKPFIIKTISPLNEQNKILNKILNNNKKTDFGIKFDFTNIRSYEDYKKVVPVHHFEMLREYIDNQLRTGNRCLTKDKPIMYARTSGTADKPKLIPVLSATVTNYKKTQSISNCAQYIECPEMFDGKILAITSCATEGNLDNVVSYGSVSGLVYKSIPKIIKDKFVIPYEVFEIENYEEKYLLICALAIAERNISAIASVNPTTILKMSEIINSRFDDLIEILENGSVGHLVDLSERGKIILCKYIKANSKRANELKKIFITKNLVCLKNLWPELKAVVTWTQGNCSVAIPKMKSLLDESTKILELGYFSSEFRGTIVLNSKGTSGVPVIDENFYEFVERNDWDSGNYSFRTIESIEAGKQYYIIVTTPYGLYRYFINDIVEVTGKYNNTPEIRFLQKGRGVTNLTGEKLYENQVIQALNVVSNKLRLNISFFIILAIPDDMLYKLYIESEPYNRTYLAKLIDDEIKNINVEYKSKRDSGRLCIPDIEFVKIGTGELYKQHCIGNGQRDTQFKFNHLIYINDCTFNFGDNKISLNEDN